MFVVGKITHTESGRYYICKTSREQWDNGYMGSGTHIRRMVAKYGKDAFTREFMAEFALEGDAYAYEQSMIGMRFVLDPLCVNLRGGGLGGHFGQKREVKPETRAKIAESLRGVPHTAERRANESRAHKGQKPSPEAIEKSRQANLGKKHSPETIAKMRAAQKLIKKKGIPNLKNRKPFMFRGKHFSCAKEAMEYYSIGKTTFYRWKKNEAI